MRAFPLLLNAVDRVVFQRCATAAPNVISRLVLAGRAILLAGGTMGGLLSLIQLVGVIRTSRVERDFTQFYFLAKGIRRGIDPNLPLPDIGAALGMPGLTLLNQPTPYPPTAGIILQPLGWLPYVPAAFSWAVVSLVSLACAVVLLSRFAGLRMSPWLSGPIVLTLLLWIPAHEDLAWGNVNMLSLGLLAGMAACLSSGRERLAGVLLAVDLLLKPVMWPILVMLLLRRRWGFVTSCLLVGGGVGLLTAVVVGPLRMLAYFTRSLPAATAYYRSDVLNISLTSLAARLFIGDQYPPGPSSHLHFAPLLSAPTVAGVLQLLIAAAVLGGGLWLTRRLPLVFAAGTMVVVGVLISPTAWDHYLVLALLPIALLLGSMRVQSPPRALRRSTSPLLVSIAIPTTLWGGIAEAFPHQVVGGSDRLWPTASALICLMPAYLLVVLAFLLMSSGRRCAETAPRPPLDRCWRRRWA